MSNFVKWQTIQVGDLLMTRGFRTNSNNLFLILSVKVSLCSRGGKFTIEADNATRTIKNMLDSYNQHALVESGWQLIKCGE